MKKRILTILLPLAMGLILCACESKEDKIQEEGDQQEALMEAGTEGEEVKEEPAEAAGGTVAVLLAGSRIQESQESAALFQSLEGEGFTVQMEFANGEKEIQTGQLEELAQEKIRGLILEPVESDGMDSWLKTVSDSGAFVVSYGDLVMNTGYVDAYVTFDYYSQGKELGEWLEEQTGLRGREADNPAYVELFALDTINDKVCYLGLMDVLTPYYEEGILVAASGQKSFEDISSESGQEGYSRCQTILEEFYGDNGPDAICAMSDGMAGEVSRALEKASYELQKEGEEEDERSVNPRLWPLVSGGNLDANGKNRIATGRQAVSFYGSHEDLADLSAEVMHELVSGEELEDASMEYDNGVKIVEAYLGGTELVDFDNLKDYR